MVSAPAPGRSPGWPQIGAWVLALVALVLAVVGIRIAEPTEPPLDVLYRGLQMFVLDGGALDGRTPANPMLEIARFLAPFATVLALLLTLRGVLDDEVHRRRIARTTGHAIVCGAGAAARVLAQNLRAHGRAVVLVGGVTPGDGAIPMVPGDPREPATLRAAGVAGARTLYACAEHSATNAAVALAAGTLRSTSGKGLSTFAQVRSDDLVEALRVRRMAADPNVITIDFFALHDIAARVLVSRYPVGTAAPVVVGFGSLGRAVLRVIVRGPGPAPQPRVVVAFAAASEVQEEATRLDAASRGWDVVTGQEDDGDGSVYICLADEDEAITTGLRLARAGNRDVMVCLERESPFRQALDAGGRLKVFGVLDEACQEESIAADSIVGRAARAIHEHYRAEAQRRGESVSTNPSMKPWAELPPHLQESNFAQAEHVSAKLVEIGGSLSTSPSPVAFAFTEQEVLRLARLEHLRWVEEREAAGYRYGPRRDGMHHPDLVDWSNLSEESRQKDIAAVRHLPELLAAESLYIWRNPSP